LTAPTECKEYNVEEENKKEKKRRRKKTKIKLQ